MYQTIDSIQYAKRALAERRMAEAATDPRAAAAHAELAARYGALAGEPSFELSILQTASG